MGYSINSRTRDGVDTLTLRDGDRAEADVAPQLGNNCFAFRGVADVFEPVSFANFVARPTSYGLPLLFPFPNRIREGEFTFQGRKYRVDPPRHGFVRDRPWTVVETGASDGEGAWIRCRLDAADHPDTILSQFPFPFVVETTHRLREGRLDLNVVATNTGHSEMPVGFGIHPYFRLPARGTIQVPAENRWELIDNLPTGTVLPPDEAHDLRRPRALSGLELDDIYGGLTTSAPGVTRCLLSDAQQGIETVVEFDVREFPFVVVFTPPARPAICIEPNSCTTDAFNLHERGIGSNAIVLPPGAQVVFNIGIYERTTSG